MAWSTRPESTTDQRLDFSEQSPGQLCAAAEKIQKSITSLSWAYTAGAQYRKLPFLNVVYELSVPESVSEDH